MFKTIFVILLAAASTLACADSELRKSVDKFCELYNPKSWPDLGSDATTQEIYAAIVKAQEMQVDHNELKQAIASADTTDFASYYHSVKQNIESLLDEPWECADFEQFYLPKQKVISLTLGEVVEKRINPQAEDVLIVMLTAGGDLLVNNAPLQSPEAGSLKAALESRLRGRDINGVNVVVYFDAGADGGRMAGVLKALAAVGIKKVDLVDYR